MSSYTLVLLSIFGTLCVVWIMYAIVSRQYQNKKSQEHCNMTDDQVQSLIRKLRVKMEWNHILGGDRGHVELSDSELRMLIECMEKSHEHER